MAEPPLDIVQKLLRLAERDHVACICIAGEICSAHVWSGYIFKEAWFIVYVYKAVVSFGVPDDIVYYVNIPFKGIVDGGRINGSYT